MASDRPIGLETPGRMRLFTVGHSTHSLDGLCALLAAHDVERIADVRRVPRSARHPQFRAESLAVELPARGVDYRHLLALGGHRRPLADSPNGAWDNDAFARTTSPFRLYRYPRAARVMREALRSARYTGRPLRRS